VFLLPASGQLGARAAGDPRTFLEIDPTGPRPATRAGPWRRRHPTVPCELGRGLRRGVVQLAGDGDVSPRPIVADHDAGSLRLVPVSRPTLSRTVALLGKVVDGIVA